ncbi:hypothetical protein EI94DRAFT_1567564 [Lactarius quietus]|nr:hypothetical protein EI94DRAFT_1567564 [Lactarius quietus]
MAFFILVFLAVLASSLVSAGPVALDNATLLVNGQQAQILNSEFENLQVNDPCNTGETACINNAFAACIDDAWQTQSCPSTKTCFALPQIRTNGTFVACTSQRNAASIIAATGAQGGITSNSTSGVTSPFPSPPSIATLHPTMLATAGTMAMDYLRQIVTQIPHRGPTMVAIRTVWTTETPLLQDLSRSRCPPRQRRSFPIKLCR